MAKAKSTTLFYCTECGNEVSKWSGQCPACKAWNTLVEAPSSSVGSARKSTLKSTSHFDNKPIAIGDIDTKSSISISTDFKEFDRVLGGGIIAGSLVLIGGDPGIGKSTLLLQMCKNISDYDHEVLYVSGEESERQIKLRADRVGAQSSHLKVFCETSVSVISEVIESTKPDVVIIDSIQTMYSDNADSAPGSPTQVRESTLALMKIAKQLSIAIFLVGHVTKEGVVAGPRMLEHMVDTVLYLEGERSASYRVLRGVKNRFGGTNEIGVFEMHSDGMVEVLNPSAYMLNGRINAPGSVVTCLMEGTRPIMLEIQALVSRSNFGLPRRTASGMDYNRVNLLMAVIEKRIGVQMCDYDAYVNIAGGMKINEPALDLALVMALISSFKNRVIDPKTIVFGEVGLAGEVRAVSQADKRVQEAKKLGFTTCIMPAVSKKNLTEITGINIIGVNNIKEAEELI
mgnify:CR=1 FL=1